jgi:hypothetical protein
MDPKVLVAIVVVLAVILVAAIVIARRRHRTTHLRQQFGSEYDRTLQVHGDARRAENELAAREARVEKLTLRDIPPTERAAFADQWTAVQARFVDDPSIAVTEADRLVSRVMAARGYPMADFDRRADDISVHYPNLVQNYRSACDIVTRHGRGNATTEDLRQAMVYYHSLFDELLGARTAVVADDTAVLRRAS